LFKILYVCSLYVGGRGTSHLHRNVAAFGEITVMPVGGGTSDSENVRVAVNEEVF